MRTGTNITSDILIKKLMVSPHLSHNLICGALNKLVINLRDAFRSEDVFLLKPNKRIIDPMAKSN